MTENHEEIKGTKL